MINNYSNLTLYFLSFLKAKLFYNEGRLFVNLGMLDLSYRFQTVHGDSCSSYVQLESAATL